MARTPSPTKTHRPNDYCTIAQAEYIAGLVATHLIRQHEAARQRRRLVPRFRRFMGRLRVALRFSTPPGPSAKD